MNKRDTKYIKTRIQSLGVRMEQCETKKGGAGPAEGDTIIIGTNTYATVPISSRFVKESPYSITSAKDHGSKDHNTEDRYILKQGDSDLIEVSFPETPKFYSYADKNGIPYWKIALRHGKDCLATTVMQKCMYWGTDDQCRFCGVELSLENDKTISLKSPEQLAGAAKKASSLDNLTHVTLTSGTQLQSRKGIEYLCDCIKGIKQESGLMIHVQVDPLVGVTELELLKDFGADTIGLHIESFDIDVLQSAAPAKARFGIKGYSKLWEKAVQIFGKNQVSSFLIAGIGESDKSIIAGTRHMAEIGVYPFILPLRPIPGSIMGDCTPPEPERMIRLYEAASEILTSFGLSSDNCQAGCVRCGACSSLSHFETAK